ncbi:MAG TPA: right-handed parallel beta-helix repeat-containing protein [Bacteroidales bacterium]|nr:right-handed parallel beta-helix repeat-containing protein [Bacteroidales bacterium]
MKTTVNKKHTLHYCNLLLLAVFAISSQVAMAQPSGGPYGPIKQKYELPKGTGKIYYVAPNGKADAPGDQLAQPTSIEAAIKKAGTGDAIIMRGGTYRTGNLTFNQGITIQPYADEQPVLKGTLEAKEWKQEGEGLWSTKWKTLFPATYESWWRRDTEEKYTPLHRFNNDVVFIDGKFLQSAGSIAELNNNTFYVDYRTKTIYIKQDPKYHSIEITAFRKAIFRTIAECNGKKSDGIGPKIYGLSITQYPDTTVHIDGFYPDGISAEKDHGNDVKGTVIENCDISNCFRIGVFTIGDNLTIRNCKISNTSTEGLYIVASDDALLEKNIFTANNIENITGCYPAAVKIFNQSYRVVCRDNLIIDLPNSNGLWFDVGNVDGRFINNWVQNVGNNQGLGSNNRLWPASNGFFFEISKGVICAGNVFVDCDHGLMILNSSNAHIYQNTFVNSTACIGRDTRSAQGDHFGWHPSTGPDVTERHGHIFVNNLLTGDRNYKRPLMLVWQPAVLCQKLDKSPIKEFDYNVFVKNSESDFNTLVYWSPSANSECQQSVESLDALKKVFEGASAHSTVLEGYNLPVFKSADLKNFELLPSFGAAKSATLVPAEIQKLLGPQSKVPYIGAYPVK